MAFGFEPNLPRLVVFDKPGSPNRLVDGYLGGRSLRPAPENVAFPVIATHFSRKFGSNARHTNGSRGRRDWRRSQFRDHPQDIGEQISRNRDLHHLEGDVAPVAHDFRADLDQLS